MIGRLENVRVGKFFPGLDSVNICIFRTVFAPDAPIQESTRNFLRMYQPIPITFRRSSHRAPFLVFRSCPEKARVHAQNEEKSLRAVTKFPCHAKMLLRSPFSPSHLTKSTRVDRHLHKNSANENTVLKNKNISVIL